jgi:hypothetical protein
MKTFQNPLRLCKVDVEKILHRYIISAVDNRYPLEWKFTDKLKPRDPASWGFNVKWGHTFDL